jgi:bifunctional non-homologous end joining protein LigD
VAGLPRLIRPMLATLVREVPGDQDRYGWELKWDGVRAVAYLDAGRVRLLSRNDKDMTASYPELRALVGMAGPPVVLDGEIVALRGGQPDFGALQTRMHVRQPAQRVVDAVPVSYYVFDLLHHGDRPLLDQPYTARRERLAGLGLDRGPVRTPPWYPGDAASVRAASIEGGLEGIVGKPLTSRYYPGKRREWIKVKNVRRQEVVIAGWQPGEGSRAGLIGSLLLGVPDDGGRLLYAGHVGTGFTEHMLRDLAQRLAPLHRPDSPFATPVPPRWVRDAHWVQPQLVGEVAFTEWTGDDLLRHPSWRGLRPDKQPGDVHREA